MRRRLAAGVVPPMLLTFAETDWFGTRDERLAAWSQARRTYFHTHGWPGGASDLIREERETRAQMNSSDYTHHRQGRRRV